MDERTRQATRLWTTVQPVVSAYLTSALRDFSRRDDVLQETAVAVLESFDRYDSSRPFIAWALGIARNQVRLALRKQRRDRHVFSEEIVTRLASAFESISPEELRSFDSLRDCVALLEGRAQQMCDLRYAHDLKPAAIAETLGMTANSVAKALQRIRDQLRECIERKIALEGKS